MGENVPIMIHAVVQTTDAYEGMATQFFGRKMSIETQNNKRKTFGQSVSPAPALEVLVAATRNFGVCTDFSTLHVGQAVPLGQSVGNQHNNTRGDNNGI